MTEFVYSHQVFAEYWKENIILEELCPMLPNDLIDPIEIRSC